MGAEATCKVRFRGAAVSGKARLETEILYFRGGDLKLAIAFKQMSKVTARGGTLSVTFADGTASFDLGAVAPKWADKILHPPSRLQKIGVKPDWRVSTIGVEDAAFLKELVKAVAHVTSGRAAPDCDAIFFGVTQEAGLSRIEKLKASLKPNGALWI